MYTILRKYAPTARTVFGLLAVTLLVSTVAFAQSDVLTSDETSGSYAIGYFIGANQAAGFPESQIHIVNPGKTGGTGITGLKLGGGDLCANIYVFTPDQQMSECCSCKISPDGMAGITLTQLTNNPANVLQPAQTGAIKIVSSFGASPTPAGLPSPPSSTAVTALPCDDGAGNVAAATAYTEVGRLDSWITHVRILGGSFGPAYSVTEIEFSDVRLSESERNKLQTECFQIIAAPTTGGFGSGHGKCSCGISM